MEKAVILIAISLIIVAIALSVVSLNFINATASFDDDFETHSYTKAICDETNYCQDYVISCNKEKILNMNPITGAAVQFSEGWQDPRDEQTINSFCVWN